MIVKDDSIIPPQHSGKHNNLTHSVIAENKEAAVDCFTRAYKRLQNPPVWHELCGTLSATATLHNASGEKAERLAALGDFIRIDIPGPGTTTGGGYDWVAVDAIEDKSDPDSEHEHFAMRLRPAPNPNSPVADTAHFFKDAATSTFIIERNGNTVTASYHGRNELPNVDTSSKADNIRNTLIAAGAFAGLSEMQWKALIKAFLEPEIGG